MSETHAGGCLCGAVAFEVKGEFEHFFFCHCSHCRKDTGSAHGANLFSSKATLNWLRGEEEVRNFTLPDTRHTKSFCSQCGSAMPNVQMQGQMLMVPAGSLDTQVDLAPTGHIFCASKASWEDTLDACPQFDGFPQ